MSRLRATNSSSPLDREILGHVAIAERAVRAALVTISRTRDNEMYKSARIASVRRDLERSLAALSNVGRVASPYGEPESRPVAPFVLSPPMPVLPDGNLVEVDIVDEGS